MIQHLHNENIITPLMKPACCSVIPREWNNGLRVEAELSIIDSLLPASIRSRQLRPGLCMHWGGERFPVSAIQSVDSEVFLFAFLLEGSWHETTADGEGRAERTGGQMLFMRSAFLHVCERCSETAFHVTLSVTQAALDELLAGDKSAGTDRVRQLARGEGDPVISLPLGAAARFSAESIRRCPFAGASRGLALAARGLDMLAEFIAALNHDAQLTAPSRLSLQDTLGQVRAAAARLLANLDQPPSISELADSVGLSESTLKRGFRQLFDTTPFGYLRARRMDHARQLLENGKATVLEAAAFVGYSNPSNFAVAFKKQFGVNPKTFQLTVRR